MTALASRAVFVAAWLGFLSVVTYAPPAAACACCADPGDRIESTHTMDASEKADLARVRFTKKARLHLDAAGTTVVRGIADPSDAYDMTLARAGDRWTFTLKDAKGRTGTLSFALPADIESFFVDPRDGKAGADIVLYKELRLGAPLTATGIFSGAAAGGPPRIRLVLQGRGNGCTSADQFTSYSIIVTGPSAAFSLFGALAAPAPA